MKRALVVTVGMIAGLGVYSYGMYHTLVPTWSNIAEVANCGVVPGAACQADTPLYFALAIAFGCTMLALHRSPFLKWMTGSLTRTVLLFLLLLGIPMLLIGLHLNYVEGTLTLNWAFHVAVYTLLITAAFGVFAWFTFVQGLRRPASGRASVRNTVVADSDSGVSANAPLPGFEFQVTYDSVSVEASARTLFKSYWRARRFATLGALVPLLLTTVLCWYFHAYQALWVVGGLVVLNILIWPFQRWAIGYRAKRSLGATADIRFTSSEFSISSPAGAYQFPWSRFLFTQLDGANLYLFVSNISAITVPTANATVEAIEFARNQVSLAAE